MTVSGAVAVSVIDKDIDVDIDIDIGIDIDIVIDIGIDVDVDIDIGQPNGPCAAHRPLCGLGCDSVAEFFNTRHEVLGSIPSTTKK